MNINDILEAITNGPFGNKTRNPKMPTLVEQIEQGLIDHEQAITVIEGFMEKHAMEAANAIDPLRLQAILAKVKEHTMRLGAIMAKFPVIKDPQIQ
jgi:hypothetical protein